MNDELDTLTDEKLSEVFAVEVAKTYCRHPLVRGDKTKGIVARFHGGITKSPGSQERSIDVTLWRDGRYGGSLWPSFATDANAVLPWLEKQMQWAINGCGVPEIPLAGWSVLIQTPTKSDFAANNFVGRAPTFARAACIALIRAHRISP